MRGSLPSVNPMKFTQRAIACKNKQFSNTDEINIAIDWLISNCLP